jgi:hypothetical protein
VKLPAVGARSGGWRTVLSDQFNSGGVPKHWGRYNGPYGDGSCAHPDHNFVENGSLVLLMAYRSSGACGATFYSGGMQVASSLGAVDQRITVRWRLVQSGGVESHFNIPMRWPDTASWPAGGEENFCEGRGLTGCSTFLHYSSSNRQISQDHDGLDLSKWNVMRFTRLDNTITAEVNGKQVWSYRGSSTTLPETVKRTVLQQECASAGCPTNRSGTERIEIDYITVENRG